MKLVHHPLSSRGKALLALFAGVAALAIALAVHTAPASALKTEPTCTSSGCDSADNPGGGSADDGSASTDPGGNSSFEGSEYGTSTPTGGDTSFEGGEYGPGAPADDNYESYETTDERADHPTDPEPSEDSDPLAKYKYKIDDDNTIGYKPGETTDDHAIRLLRNGVCWPTLRKETRLHREIKRGQHSLRFFHTAQEELDILVEEYFDSGCGAAMQGIVRPN